MSVENWSHSGYKVTVVTMLVILSLVTSGCIPTYKGLTAEEKLEDFRYLFDLFSENNGIVTVTARMTGFDWLAHREQFEEEVKGTGDDEEFALVISKLLAMTLEGHTRIVPWQTVATYGASHIPLYREMVRREGSKGTADYWFNLAHRRDAESTYRRFPAMYHAGEYIVVKEFTAGGATIRPGYRVIGVNGTPVDRYVAGHLGYVHLSWDPVRRKTYEDPLLVPVQADTLIMTFRDLGGKLVEVKFSAKDLPSWQYRRCPVHSGTDGVVLRQGLFVKVFPELAAYIRVGEMFEWSG